MRKRTIAWLFIIGIILFAAGSGVNGAGMVAHTMGVILTGAAISAVGLIIVIVSWIGALVATVRQGRWGWFVLVFLLIWLGELIYLFAGPGLDQRPALA